MKTALFLGAGASAFVGCPTTKDLRDLVLAEVRKRSAGPADGDWAIHLKFLERIIQDERLDDIEKVYSCVDRILHSSNTYSDAVLDNVTYNDGGVSMKVHEILATFGTLKSIIREIMLDRFTVPRDGARVIKEWYDGLFDVVGDASGSVDIITTNYDNIIETYCDHADMQLADGFVPSRNGDHRVWNGSWNVADGGVRLVKLHGSAAWQRDGDGIIEMRWPGSRMESEDILVAPTLEAKDYSYEPFPQLFKQRDAILSRTDVLVAIGYSFRDDVINTKIIDAIGRGMSMLVVSPDAERDVRMNLKPAARLTEDDRPRIETKQKIFGPETADGVRMYLKNVLG